MTFPIIHSVPYMIHIAQRTERGNRIGTAQASRTEGREFESQPSQTSTYKFDICCYLSGHLALIGYGKDWIAQCPDNVIVQDIGSWCRVVSQCGSTINSS